MMKKSFFLRNQCILIAPHSHAVFAEIYFSQPFGVFRFKYFGTGFERYKQNDSGKLLKKVKKSIKKIKMEKQKRYCKIESCQHFSGTSNAGIRMFRYVN